MPAATSNTVQKCPRIQCQRVTINYLFRLLPTNEQANLFAKEGKGEYIAIMEQSVKHNDEYAKVIARKFSRPTLERLQAVDERAINELLDDAEADQEIADAILYNKTHAPDEVKPYAELREELIKEGLL